MGCFNKDYASSIEETQQKQQKNTKKQNKAKKKTSYE
jgi:hypothetical protein